MVESEADKENILNYSNMIYHSAKRELDGIQETKKMKK